MPSSTFPDIDSYGQGQSAFCARAFKIGDTAPTLTSVKVVIQYPSKPVNQTLAKEYEAIGKALAYGPPHRLAKAVTKNKELIKVVVHSVMKLLSNEVSALCSRKNPSLLRKCGKESKTL